MRRGGNELHHGTSSASNLVHKNSSKTITDSSRACRACLLMTVMHPSTAPAASAITTNGAVKAPTTQSSTLYPFSGAVPSGAEEYKGRPRVGDVDGL